MIALPELSTLRSNKDTNVVQYFRCNKIDPWDLS